MKLNFRFEYIMNKHKLASVLKVRIEFPVSHGRQSFLPRKVYRYAKYTLIRNIVCSLINIWYMYFPFFTSLVLWKLGHPFVNCSSLKFAGIN